MILFKPGAGDEPTEPLTWKDFCQWTSQLSSENTDVNKHLLTIIHRYVHGMSTTQSLKKMMSCYRGRARTKWNEEEMDTFKHSQTMEDFVPQAMEDLFLNELKKPLSSRAILQMKESFAYIDRSTSNFKKLFSHGPRQNVNNDKMDKRSRSISFPVKSTKEIYSLHEELIKTNGTADLDDYLPKAKQNPNNNPSIKVYESVEQDSSNDKDELWLGFEPNKEQQEIINEMDKYFLQLGPYNGRKEPTPDPPFFNVQGGPGVGKTTMINGLVALALFREAGQVITCAYTGVAASHMGGQTTTTQFKLPVGKRNAHTSDDVDEEFLSNTFHVKDLKDLDKILDLVKKIDPKKTCLIVIDEVSMITATMLAYIDARCRQATQRDMRFGGIAMILCGDFSQSPPVNGVSLFSAAIRIAEKVHHGLKVVDGKDVDTGPYKAGGAIAIGVSLFNQAKLIRLTIQERCKEDEEHTAFIRRMGEGLPVTDRDLKRFKKLSDKDFKEDPSAWQFAVILVTTNRERADFNHIQAINYAKTHGEVVIRWPVEIVSWKHKPSILFLKDAMKETILYHYFVRTAPGFLTENINPSIGLANGTGIQDHSLTFADRDIQNELENTVSLSQAGDVVTFPHQPASINVLAKDKNGKVITDWKHPTLLKGMPLVPIIVPRKHPVVTEVCVKGGVLFDHSIAKIKNDVGVELGFCVTFHKGQGRTIQHVIVALSKRPRHLMQLVYSSFFVAVTRIKNAKKLRILCIDGDGSLNYITELRPHPHLTEWWYGFDGKTTGYWNSKLAVEGRLKRRKEATEPATTKGNKRKRKAWFSPSFYKRRKKQTTLKEF